MVLTTVSGCHDWPPSVVRATNPAVPEIQAVVGLSACTPKSTLTGAPGSCGVQCTPPSLVCRSVPNQPTAQPLSASANDTAFMNAGGASCCVQCCPPSTLA